MAWSTPLTAVANASLTAAQWNASVRDNLLETAPAKATTAGSIFVATGSNSIAQRPVLSDTVTATETSASTTYTDITTFGPSVTTTTGDKALLFDAAQINNSTAATTTLVSWAVSGATTIAADDNNSINLDTITGGTFQDIRAADVRRLTGLNPGSNTFTLKYRCTGGTGTYGRRHLIIIGL